MLHLKKQERDLGVCAVVLCPHCQKSGAFHLWQIAANLRFFGVPLVDMDRTYQIICSHCKFRRDLKDVELLAAMRAKRLYSKLESQEIDPQKYLDGLGALDFPTLCQLREDAMTWACTNCREKVPPNFINCWNCNSPRPGSEKSRPTESFDPSILPRDVTRNSPNPWEGP
jgi:hypothetical protein